MCVHVTCRSHGFLKKCSQFGSAVWPAILKKNFADFMKKVHKSNFIRANI